MRSTTALSIALVVPSLVLAPRVTAQAAEQMSHRVDSLFAEWDRADSPGAAVGVIKDGMVVHRRGYGSANLEYQIPITPTTVFDIASVSKQFAGMAVAMLVESGTLSLDDDVRTYIPEVPDFGKTITIRHLVHHTSGIRDWPGALGIAGWRMDDVIAFDQILRMAFHQRDLNFVPGAEYLYSNTGYNLLAETVARVLGQSFREWTDANIFQPLGMTNTHFQNDHQEVVTNKAYAYATGGADGPKSIPNGLTAQGSSSLFTTVDDLAKWAMNFENARVGGQAVIARMHQRGVLNDGEQISYAFGQSAGMYRGLETWSHGGSWAGFRTTLVRYPAERFAVIVLSNVSGFNPGRMAQQIADIYLADELEPIEETAVEPGPRPSEEVRVDPGILDDYEGTYKLGPGWLVTITRQGNWLMTQATAEAQYRMTPVSETEFYVRAYSASITFLRDEEGAVNQITYRGNTAPRVEPFTWDSEQLVEFAGDYHSEELDTTYRLAVQDGVLVAHHRRHGEIELTPVRFDEFRADAWFLRGINFARDDAGVVTGFLVTNGRVRNLKFEKR